jgi:sulfhydrogenase subunit delta
MADKVKIGIYGLTGCGGDQLTILNCEDELLDLVEAADVVSFLMAKSDNREEQLDVAFVEGSVSTRDDQKLLEEVRGRCKLLIALGNCACFGGPQAMKAGDGRWKERMNKVYGENWPSPSEALEAQPLSAVVKVDFLIPGCPIAKRQFLRTLGRLLRGGVPQLPVVPVCVECKFRENECLLLKGIPCLGPVTAAGCGAVCPTYQVPCVGCFGPVDEANIASEYLLLYEKGYDKDEVIRRMRMYGGVAAEALTSGLPEPPPRAAAPADAGPKEAPEGAGEKPGEAAEQAADTGQQDTDEKRSGGIFRRRNRKR